MTKKAKKIQAALLKKENEIVRGNKLFCSINNIEWTKEHDTCLRNAMRAFFTEGVYPIVEELFTAPLKDYFNQK